MSELLEYAFSLNLETSPKWVPTRLQAGDELRIQCSSKNRLELAVKRGSTRILWGASIHLEFFLNLNSQYDCLSLCNILRVIAGLPGLVIRVQPDDLPLTERQTMFIVLEKPMES